MVNLDGRYAGEFPTTGNQLGVSAALRLQAAFDLVSGEAIRLDLTNYKRVDQSAACDIISQLQPGDLLSISGAPSRQLLGRWVKQMAYHECYEPRKTRTNMALMLEKTLGLPATEIGSGI